jgi:SAM-dependent methyltransferase|tara:strand:+ start:2042 stop:2644 length:603 start_codon:yes stop_codon:yes gene_type:complete
MGRSDPYIFSFYRNSIRPTGDTALLGFTNNSFFGGDLYDLRLGNWDINSDWQLDKKYDTIICTRCAYFAKQPEQFIERCYNSLNDGGRLYVDWGLGDHWRFDDYKVGWVKNGEHEYAYKDDNFLWSTIWDDSFLENEQFNVFSQRVKKFGYEDMKKEIFEEVPKVLIAEDVEKYFSTSYSLMALWEDNPQIYILLCGVKR